MTENINLKNKEFNVKEIFLSPDEDYLGDRTKYIGATDISEECIAKTIKSKTLKSTEIISETQQITFILGHMFEDKLAIKLKQHNYNFVREYIANHDEYNITAHPDFYIIDNDYIVECKTTARNITEVYDKYKIQVQFQLGMMRYKKFNTNKAKIIALNFTNKEMVEEEIIYDESIFKELMQKAFYILNKINLNEPLEESDYHFSYLCPFCPFKNQCEKYINSSDEFTPELINKIDEYIKLSAFYTEIWKKKEELRQFIAEYGNFEYYHNKTKIICNSGRLSVY
jgi:hypothetical protein